MIDDAGELVSGGDLCLGRADTGLQAAIEGTQGAVTAGYGSRSLEEGLAGAVMALAGGGTDDLATGNLVVGGQFEPGAEMLCAGKAAHIGTDFADDLLRQVKTEPVYRGEVNAGDAAQVLAHMDGGVLGQILAVRAALVRG